MAQPIDYTAWRFWLDIIVLVAVAANTAHTWWSNSKKATAKRLRAIDYSLAGKVSSRQLEETMAAHQAQCHSHRQQTSTLESSLTQLRAEFGHLPSRHEIQALNSSIASLAKEMGEFKGRLDGINRAVDLVNEHLINQGSKQ